MISAPSRVRSLLVIGLSAYLLFAVVSFPASLAIAWFAPDGMTASGVSGTAWSGHADTIATPQATLADTSWSARPLSLLTAKLSYRLRSTIGGGSIETIASISPTGTIRLQDVSGVLPLSILPTIVPFVTIDGRIGLDVDNILIEEQWPTDAQGTIDIVGLNVVSPFEETLGSFAVVFAGANESGLEGQASEVDGPLVLSGTLSLRDDKTWDFAGTVKPTPAASAQLSQGLATYMGPPNPDGSYNISYPQ